MQKLEKISSYAIAGAVESRFITDDTSLISIIPYILDFYPHVRFFVKIVIMQGQSMFYILRHLLLYRQAYIARISLKRNIHEGM